MLLCHRLVEEEEFSVGTPLYEMKAEFFKTLGHPARIRILELLSEGERHVSELLTEVGLEPSHLSQQLGVLKRAGLVGSNKHGSSVSYYIISPEVAELLAVARRILTEVLTGAADLLKDLNRSQTGPGSSPMLATPSVGKGKTSKHAGRS